MILMPDTPPAAPPVTFEAGLEELEKIVKQMESGDLPLEKAIQLFESGMTISERCRKQLAEAETRVELLVRRGQYVVAEPFDEEADEDPASE